MRLPSFPLLCLPGLVLLGCPVGGPVVVADPPVLNFGEVEIGDTARLPLSVSNTGGTSTTLVLETDGGGPFSVDVIGSIELNAGDERTVFVEAVPTAEGVAVGLLALAWSDGIVEVDLQVNGVEGDVDVDGDGFEPPDDCDDSDPLVNPDADELCNGADDDCDEDVDEGFDEDGDLVLECGDDGVMGTADDDCEDDNEHVYPGADEVCNGSDDDCDTLIDEGFDVDSDTFSTCEDDCNDQNANIRPGAVEVCNGIDDDCDTDIDEGFDNDGDGEAACVGDCDDNDPTVNGIDADGDGASTCDLEPDCDDADDLVYPNAQEICDGIDNNCDLAVDEGLDGDNDGVTSCGADGVPGNADDDCDDTSGAVYPGAADTCDVFLDNDCDGVTDPLESDDDGDGNSECQGDCDDTSVGGTGTDADGDGFTGCSVPADCDDNDNLVYPGAPEICDGADNNCSGTADEGLDGDNDSVTSCGPDGVPGNADDDCDPTDGDVYPGAPDVCDGVDDNDCDGAVDPSEDDGDGDGASSCAGDCDDADATLSIADEDADGVDTCAATPDCDDDDNTRFPGATELCADPDYDCDGQVSGCVSCQEALDVDPSRGGADGLYLLDPDGAGGDAAFDGWCDMTTLGGGWTLVLRTTDDSASNLLQQTSYANFHDNAIGSAAAGPMRVAGKHWETLADNGDGNDEMMLMHSISTTSGGTCAPLYYALSGAGNTLSVPAAGGAQYAYTGADPAGIVNGATNGTGPQVQYFSTTDNGPKAASCVNATSLALPWFFTGGAGCGTNLPAFGYPHFLAPASKPFVHNGLLGTDLYGTTAAAACTGATPQATRLAGYYAEAMQERYVR